MSAFIDSLNLRPQEKRVLVGVIVVVFVVLDLVFVQPHFRDRAVLLRQLKDAQKGIADANAKIKMDTDPVNGYKQQLRELLKMEGSNNVGFSEIQLQKTVAAQARISNINVSQYDSVSISHQGPTNQASQFFESQSLRITVAAREDQLVNFLYNVGNDPAMIRVRELTLQPELPNRFQLKGQITLTADYKKTAPAKAVAAAPRPRATPPTVAPRNPTPVPPAAARHPTPAANPPTTGSHAKPLPSLPAFPAVPSRARRGPGAAPVPTSD